MELADFREIWNLAMVLFIIYFFVTLHHNDEEQEKKIRTRTRRNSQS